MTVLRYSPFADGAPEGWPDEYVSASDYEAIVGRLAEADRLPNLGCATTLQLINELRARAEVHGYGDYRTVDEPTTTDRNPETER